jgi:hypothetical protein
MRNRLHHTRSWIMAVGAGLALALLNIAVVLANNSDGQFP